MKQFGKNLGRGLFVCQVEESPMGTLKSKQIKRDWVRLTSPKSSFIFKGTVRIVARQRLFLCKLKSLQQLVVSCCEDAGQVATWTLLITWKQGTSNNTHTFMAQTNSLIFVRARAQSVRCICACPFPENAALLYYPEWATNAWSAWPWRFCQRHEADADAWLALYLSGYGKEAMVTACWHKSAWLLRWRFLNVKAV